MRYTSTATLGASVVVVGATVVIVLIETVLKNVLPVSVSLMHAGNREPRGSKVVRDSRDRAGDQEWRWGPETLWKFLVWALLF